MNILAKKNNYKRITWLLLIVLVCNFLVPQPNYAGDNELHLARFFCSIGDLVLMFIQGQMVGTSTIQYSGESEFSIKYSPGIIFSGTLPVFDINFISPVENKDKYVEKVTEKNEKVRYTVVKATSGSTTDETVAEFCTADALYDATSTKTYKLATEYIAGEDLVRRSDVIVYMQKLQEDYNFFKTEVKEKVQDENIEITSEEKIYSLWLEENGNTANVYKIYVKHTIDNTNSETLLRVYQVRLTKAVYEKQPAIVSIAKVMRNTIASWYKTMREIALIGLLSVLTYVAIRGIISNSAEDKAKYKKLLLDWIVAVVIILTLHYIISFTLTITQKISEIFNVNIIGEDGRDIIFSKLRQDIHGGLLTCFIKTVMYYAFVIMTIKFTIEYFKRVIYMGFLTMIAPIIGLTYPLDKIKDGQAQAFTLWIREFVFNALIQPLHLLLYYVFIGSSIMGSFAEQYPFYGLIVMAFLKPAEQMLRKMFGFDKGGKLGSLESAFGGAAVMNMLNKAGKKPAGGGGASSGSTSGGESTTTNSNVRMANDDSTDYYSALRQSRTPITGGAFARQFSGGSQTRSAPTSEFGTNLGANGADGSKSSSGNGQNNAGTKPRNARGADNFATNKNKKNNKRTRTKNNTSSNKSIKNKPSTSHGKKKKTRNQQIKERARKGSAIVAQQKAQVRLNEQDNNLLFKKSKVSSNNVQTKTEGKKTSNIKGFVNVGKKVFSGAGKGALTASLKLTGMAMVGTYTLAYSLTQEDSFEKAIPNTIMGMTAGSKLGKKVANTVTNAGSSIRESGRNIRDTYNQGKYGEKEAQRRKAAREFKNGKEYEKLLNKHPGSEKTIDKLLNAGITDAKKIRIALDNSNNYSTDNAIAYMNMAKLCPGEVFEDRDKFNTYLESHGISKEKADEIYKAVREYR